MKRFLLLLAVCGVLSAQPPALLTLDKVQRTLQLEGETHHVQGIDTDGERLWVTAVDRPTGKGFLYEFSLIDGKRLRSIELQRGDLYHPGGIAADATSIWVPLAEYRARSSAVIQRRNKRTLAIEFEFEVPDHIGCLAITPEFIVGGNWDSREFYFWDHQGKLLRKIESHTANSYQDLKYRDGKLLASGTLSNGQGALDWLDISHADLEGRMLIGTTSKGLSLAREGMTEIHGELLYLPEDDSSKVYVFKMP